MRDLLLPDSLVARFCIAAAVIGVVAGVIGSNNVGWNLQGIALGLYLAALGLWINEV